PYLLTSHLFFSFLLFSTLLFLFFFNDPATTEIYTLSLHDALPICPRAGPDLREQLGPRRRRPAPAGAARRAGEHDLPDDDPQRRDRKSTRLNSSHVAISYAVFCLKKKKKKNTYYIKKTRHTQLVII